MPEQFLHGIQVVEVDSGIRPIRTVETAVIGVVGTAPDSAPAVAANLTVGSGDAALALEAVEYGVSGNSITVAFVVPEAVSQELAVSVASGVKITVSLATDEAGTAISTATQVAAAINAHVLAKELVLAVAGGTGAGVVAAKVATALTGGVNEAFPLDTPVLIAGSLKEAAKLDITGNRLGTLPAALDGIFDQVGAVVVVVRVAEGEDAAATITNVIGGVDGLTGAYRGIKALIGARDSLQLTPRILIAPGFSREKAVADELIAVANTLRAVVAIDGPNTTDEAAVAYRQSFGDRRVMPLDPWLQIRLPDGRVVEDPPSARWAGAAAWMDSERGFWHSISNVEIKGVVGVCRPVSFHLNDANTTANYLNANEVTTVVYYEGYRFWGNRTCSSDPKWAFLADVRTADLIGDSLIRAHFWAVDRNIVRTYPTEVAEGVNAYLRRLVNEEALLGGKCVPNKELSTAEELAAGSIYFDFDWRRPPTAEKLTFRSYMNNGYLEELV